MAFNGNRLDLSFAAVFAAVAVAAALVPRGTCGAPCAVARASCGVSACACCNASRQEVCGTNTGAPDVAPAHVCGCEHDATVPEDAVFEALPVRFEYKPYAAIAGWPLPMSRRIPPCADAAAVTKQYTLAAVSSPPPYLSACSLLISTHSIYFRQMRRSLTSSAKQRTAQTVGDSLDSLHGTSLASCLTTAQE